MSRTRFFYLLQRHKNLKQTLLDQVFMTCEAERRVLLAIALEIKGDLAFAFDKLQNSQSEENKLIKLMLHYLSGHSYTFTRHHCAIVFTVCHLAHCYIMLFNQYTMIHGLACNELPLFLGLSFFFNAFTYQHGLNNCCGSFWGHSPADSTDKTVVAITHYLQHELCPLA